MEIKSLKDIEKAITDNSYSLEEKAISQMNDIIAALPPHIKNLINEAFKYKRIPKEYLLSSIFFAFSNVAGLAFRLDAVTYSNYGNIYLALIGSRGDSKSPAMELATAPLNEYDTKMYKEFIEKSQGNGFEEPTVRKQLLIQDATIEAAYQKHYENPFSLGIYMDELYHLMEKMSNKASRDGLDWRQLLLQGNTNKHVDIIRKTTNSFRLPKACPILLGSIQEEFIPQIFSGGNEISGFTDRLLYTPKLTHNSNLSRCGISEDCLRNYSDNLLRLMEHRISIEHKGLNHPHILTCTTEAEDLIFNYTQDLLNRQEHAECGEKEYLSKVQINVLKMMILTHLIKQSATPELRLKIEPKTVHEAIQIIEFYITNFKIIRQKRQVQENNINANDIIKFGRKNNATQEQIAAVLGVHKSTISRKITSMKI